MFEFEMRAAPTFVLAERQTRWDQAQNITVRAKTKDEAVRKAGAVLGSVPSGYHWTFMIDSIKEVKGE